ncbi:MAG: general secretion pathway protein GspK [Spirochaetes bacterium]|nr:general secretion pathway protein GspK [Spirochaetota bacterium]
MKSGNLYKSFKKNYENRRINLEQSGIFKYFLNSQGYILIIVLTITALLISVSSQFLLTAQQNINYMKKFRNEAVSEQIALSGLELSKFILEADLKGFSSFISNNAEKNKEIDSYHDIWAYNFPEIPIENSSVKVVISDSQSKLNISAVSNQYVPQTPYFKILKKFFNNLGMGNEYSDSILDWVDTDNSRSAYGGEEYDFYSTLPVYYRCKNGPFDSMDELLLVKNFTPEIYYGLNVGNSNSDDEKNLVENNRFTRTYGNEDKTDEVKIGPEKSLRLSDYFRVYGNNNDYTAGLNKININTAPFRILSALTDEITDNIVTEIISRRSVKPFTSVDEIKDLIPDDSVRNSLLTVSSNIYEIEITSYTGKNEKKVTAVYNRSSKKFYYLSIH